MGYLGANQDQVRWLDNRQGPTEWVRATGIEPTPRRCSKVNSADRSRTRQVTSIRTSANRSH